MLAMLLSYQQLFLLEQVEVMSEKQNDFEINTVFLSAYDYFNIKSNQHTLAPPPATIGPRYFSFSVSPRNTLQ